MATIPPILSTSSPVRTSSTLLSSPPSSPARVSTTLGVAGSSSALRISTSESTRAIVVETTVGRSTTTVRPASPTSTTTSTRISSTIRTTSTSTSTTRLSSNTITSTSSSSSVTPSLSTSTTTVQPYITASSTSSVSSIVSSSSSSSASVSASAGASNSGGSGLNLGTGAIAAIATSLTLLLLALLLIGYRYYSRKQRQRRRASSRFSAAYYGGNKAEGGVDGGEKEVTPYRIGFTGEEGEGGYGNGGDIGDGHGGKVYGAGSGYSGYPPPPPPLQHQYAAYQEPRLDAYGQPISHSDGIEPAYAPYSTPKQDNKNLPVLPMPVPKFNPGTPNTFGSFGSAQVQEATPNPLVVARERGLRDGEKVWVRQGFIRSLDDELVITPGDELILVQAYDDGWSLCEDMKNGERGVVPLNCLEAGAASVPEAREEMLNVPGMQDDGRPGISRSSTAASLALSDRSQRRSSLYQNAQAAGMYLQRGQSPGR